MGPTAEEDLRTNKKLYNTATFALPYYIYYYKKKDRQKQ